MGFEIIVSLVRIKFVVFYFQCYAAEPNFELVVKSLLFKLV